MSQEIVNIQGDAKDLFTLANKRIHNGQDGEVRINNAILKKKSPHYPDLNLITVEDLQIYFTNNGDIVTVDEVNVNTKEYPHTLQRTTIYSNSTLTDKVKEQVNKLYREKNIK